MNRRGLRPRWGVYAVNVKDLTTIGIETSIFVNKIDAEELAKKLRENSSNGNVEVKRVMVAKGKNI